MSKIDIFTVEKFIDRLEKFVKPNLPTNELISFGEKRLALDILLENLIEEKIIIDKETLSLLATIEEEEIRSSISYLYSLSDKG